MARDTSKSGAPRTADASTVDGGIGTHAQRAALEARIFGTRGPSSHFGRFVVLDKLGEGGMGMVFGAYDPQLDRRVALKVVRTRAGLGTVGRSRLLREGKALGRLSHPNVVAVHDVGLVEDDLFIAMEYVEGGNLSQWVQAHPEITADRQREALRLMVDAARGLAAAHAAGLVHRDLKPANTLVGSDGRLRLADFGLVLHDQDDDAEVASPGPSAGDGSETSFDKLTETGAILGTPAYMAPEQFEGRADARSDQFSLCATFYEVLFGCRPFDGASAIERLGSFDAGPRSPTSRAFVPTAVERLLRRGLCVDPAARFATMDELLAELERAITPRRWGTLAALGLGAVAVGVTALLPTHAPRELDCMDGSHGAAQVWGDAQRRRLAEQLSAAGELAADSVPRVVASLDTFVERWSGTYAQACQASADEPKTFELSWSCLAERKRQLEIRVDVLTDPDAKTASRASEIVATLPDPADCADPRELLLRDRLRPPESIAARVQSLYERRDALVVEGTAQRFEGLADESEALVAEAEDLDFAPLLGAAVFQRAWVRRMLGAPGGDDDFARAFALAQRAGDDRLAASAATALAYGYERNQRPDDAMRWIEVAQAAVARAGITGKTAHVVARAHGELAHQAGDSERAIELLRAQYERVKADPDAGFEELALTERTLARVLYETERYEPALALVAAARERLRDGLGERHSWYAETLRQQARLLLDLGQVDDALALKREQQARFAALGLEPDWRSRVIEGLFFHDVHRQSGDLDDALAVMREADVLMHEHGPDSLLRAEVLAAVAERELDLGDREAGRAHAETSLRITQAHEDGTVRLGVAYLAAARARIDSGRLDEAITLLEDAIDRTPPALQAHAAMRAELARALSVQGAQPVRADELATEALRALRGSVPYAPVVARLQRQRQGQPDATQESR